MSGERFYVVELFGRDNFAVGGTGGTLTCSVLDRAYCHREVARFNEPRGAVPGESGRRPKAGLRAWPQEQADAEAARLNAEHDAWAAA